MMKSPAESSPRTEFSILLAADSFKGSASSEAIEEYLEAGVLCALPHAQIKKVLIADGGEGTVDAFVSGCGGEIKSVQAEDPFGHPIVARLGVLLPDPLPQLIRQRGIARLIALHDLVARLADGDQVIVFVNDLHIRFVR